MTALPDADPGDRVTRIGEAALAVDGAGIVTACNAAAGSLLRADPAALVGWRLAELIPERFRDAHRRAFAEFAATGSGPMVTATPVRMLLQRADGAEVDLDVCIRAVGRPGEPGFGAISTLREPPPDREGRQPRHRFLQAIVDAAPDGILAVSPERRILAVNRRFQELWNLPDEAVQVDGVSPALTEGQLRQVADPDGFEAALRWGHQHPDRVQRLDVALLDGRVIEGYSAPILEAGVYVGRVWYLHDATERRSGETQRAALMGRLAAVERSQRFLLDAADALARSTGLADAVQALAEVAVPILGDLCLIDILDEHGGVARMAAVHADSRRRAQVERLLQWPPDPAGTHPSVTVMRERRSMYSREMPPEFLAATTRSGEHFALLRELGFTSYMAVPLVAGAQVLGAVTLVSAGSGRVFGPEDVSLAEDLAGRVASVVAKERRYDRERQASHTLQTNLLPLEVVPVPGLEVAVRYLTGTRDAEVGGDFWDLAVLPSGEVGIALGDVAGHDMIAAAQMAQLRSVFRALRRQATGPSELIGAVQDVWDQLGLDRLATAVFLRVQPWDGRVRLASAGHPVPVVVPHPGEAWYPEVEPAAPLGAPGGGPAATWAANLPAGAALVLYTDGLIEHRDRHLGDGMAALREVAAAAPSTHAEALADHVIAALTTDDRSDDVAVMVVRLATPATGDPPGAGPAAARFEPDPFRASEARRFVVEALGPLGLGRFADDAAVCTAELVTNAVLHARTPFTVSVRPAAGGLRIDVVDDRPELLPQPVPAELPPLQSGTTGRGLMLVAGLATRWGCYTTEAAKTVWVELADARRSAPAPPVVEVARRAPDAEGVHVIELLAVPVGPGIASGVHVDDLVRELQLDPGRLSDAERAELIRLLDLSAPPRLAGRHAVLRAAGEGRERCDIRYTVADDELAAMVELPAFLHRLVRRGLLDAVHPSPEVAAMRAWVVDQIDAQLAGAAPSPYPNRGE